MDEARKFTREHGPVIYKPLRNTDYHDADGRALTVWVEEVHPADLTGTVGLTMHLFQKRVASVADLRVTAVGDEVFGVRIDGSPGLDWRRLYDSCRTRSSTRRRLWSRASGTTSTRSGWSSVPSTSASITRAGSGCTSATRTGNSPGFRLLSPTGSSRPSPTGSSTQESTMPADPAALRLALADEIAAGNPTLDPSWRDAVAAVPRELFVDDAFFRHVGTGWTPVRRAESGDAEWLGMVYTDSTWVTQVDGRDVADVDGPITGSPTSSATLPSLVVRTAQVADLQPGQRVLEVGTGSGYSTAVLCHRLGAENVVSVEYDAGLAATAAAHLRAAGYTPTLAVGDGLRGCGEHADYDAVTATCSVRYIPPQWFWQLNDGGSITTTICGWMQVAGLIRLVLDDEGTAHGRFTADNITYMLARPHERPPSPLFFKIDGDTTPTRVDPALLEQWEARFVAQLSAPSAELMETGSGIILRDVATGSQAWTEPKGGGWIVHQHGPLRLWDQVEDALAQWQQAGAADLSEFGMTATPDSQTVWIGSPQARVGSFPYRSVRSVNHAFG